MVMHPSRSKEWFPLAEQIINTIYALADRPDALCDAIIKDLTRRAFQRGATSAIPQNSDPDAMDEDEITQPTSTMSSSQNATHSQGGKDIGDSFTLSQMIFVVGHVAIKHIAYLELVEREWKRQKDIKDAGTMSNLPPKSVDSNFW
jgi:condensin complex subunit 1